MNQFYDKYEIRLANYDEIPLVMQFIKDEWKNDHILGNNRQFFEYEMVVDNQVNCVIARQV